MSDDTSPETPLAKTLNATPAEALLALEEDTTRYGALVDRMGFALACYQLATWRLGAHHMGKPVPSKSDLRSAALTFRNRLGMQSVPSGNAIAAECRSFGRKVI